MRASDAQQLCPGQDHQLVDLWNDAQPGLGLNNTAELCELQQHSKLPYPVTANGQPNSACVYEDDVFLNRVEDLLQQRGIKTRRFKKPTFTRVAPDALRQEIAQSCDAVVEALAD